MNRKLFLQTIGGIASLIPALRTKAAKPEVTSFNVDPLDGQHGNYYLEKSPEPESFKTLIPVDGKISDISYHSDMIIESGWRHYTPTGKGELTFFTEEPLNKYLELMRFRESHNFLFKEHKWVFQGFIETIEKTEVGYMVTMYFSNKKSIE